jgi:hypothetical protein
MRARGVAKPKAAEHHRTPKRKRHITLAIPRAASQRRRGEKVETIGCRGSVLACASALALWIAF